MAILLFVSLLLFGCVENASNYSGVEAALLNESNQTANVTVKPTFEPTPTPELTVTPELTPMPEPVATPEPTASPQATVSAPRVFYNGSNATNGTSPRTRTDTVGSGITIVPYTEEELRKVQEDYNRSLGFGGWYDAASDPDPPFVKTNSYTPEELRVIFASMNASYTLEQIAAVASVLKSFDGRKYVVLNVFGNITIRAYHENADMFDSYEFDSFGVPTSMILSAIPSQYVQAANKTAVESNPYQFFNYTPYPCLFSVRWRTQGVVPACYDSDPSPYFTDPRPTTFVYVDVRNSTINEIQKIHWRTN